MDEQYTKDVYELLDLITGSDSTTVIVEKGGETIVKTTMDEKPKLTPVLLKVLREAHGVAGSILVLFQEGTGILFAGNYHNQEDMLLDLIQAVESLVGEINGTHRREDAEGSGQGESRGPDRVAEDKGDEEG